MTTIIYLDFNCFQRGFDDPHQTRIRMEALACEWIFVQAEEHNFQLAWSFMHDDENEFCPFLERQIEALRLSDICKVKIKPHDDIYNKAKTFQKNGKLSSKDSIHLAAASYIKADYFLTCDDQLIKRAKRLDIQIKIINPVDYVREKEN